MSLVMIDEGSWQPCENMKHNTARDSLSPKRVYAYIDRYGGKENVGAVVEDEVELQLEEEGADSNAYGSSTKTSDLTSVSAILGMTTTPASTMADTTCSPRFALARNHRPYALELDDSRGLTSVSSTELRHLIKQTAAYGAAHLSVRIQVIDHTSLQTPLPAKGRKRYPRPDRTLPELVRQPSSLPPAIPERSQRRQPLRLMGNQQSNHGSTRLAAASSSSIGDVSTSTDSMIYNPKFKSREQPKRPPVAVLKKRMVTKQAPEKLTGTIIEVPRAATAPNLDAMDDEQAWEDEQQGHTENEVIRHKKTLSAPSAALLSHPVSPVTMTEELASRPLSAGTTITRMSTQSQEMSSSPARLRVSALSPTIPTPSPLPEDSPHQYGLKDFAETPTPPQDQKQARRRSNGIDIFNEAKNLQSAASFLNGLSTARRRAESQARTRSTSRLTDVSNIDPTYSSQQDHSAYCGSRQSYQELEESPSRPLTPKLDDLSRTLGHTHKSSGFAYAKPLSVAQLQCYRKHERLIRSGNTLYQVECAVCHKDESGDYYWSCSWCALRMCEECRLSFRVDGMKALKDKIREAELGAQ